MHFLFDPTRVAIPLDANRKTIGVCWVADRNNPTKRDVRWIKIVKRTAE